MSALVDDVLARLVSYDTGELEFHQATREVLESAAPLIEATPRYRKSGLLDRIVEPERQLIFRVPWQDDQGQVHVNRGFRVEFNSALGPYKGGLRFHPSVNLGIVKSLAFEQTFKNALTALNMGGGKGGADFQPRGRSDDEIMRFCQSFMTELWRHIGPSTDVPAGDIGVGAREVGYLFGQYKRLTNRFEGALTGKGAAWGGSLLRPEATGYGLVYFAAEMLATKGETFEGKTVCLSGYGNVGGYAMEKLNQLGAKVVTIADEDGFIYDPDGITGEKAQFVLDMWSLRRAPVTDYAERFKVEYREGRPWQVPCDAALPTAAQNEIDGDDARRLLENGCKLVAEGANIPCTPEAIDTFQEAGILYAPGKASNAGGVAVSGLEMSQNSMRMSWTKEEVDDRLKMIMRRIHTISLETAERFGLPGDYLRGANLAAFQKVADAMLDQGLV